jgi:hypothetical protein
LRRWSVFKKFTTEKYIKIEIKLLETILTQRVLLQTKSN